MKILGTGLNGLVGSRVVDLLKDKYEFESSEVDVTDRLNILKKIKDSKASVVLHLAAKTNVDGCELDRSLGEKGEAWKINVEGTRNVVDACLASGKKLIYISTDFVFDGTYPSAFGYSEEDIPNPLNWYAQTKYEGEKIVQMLPFPWIIARIAYPYRANFVRKDFARTLINRLKDKESLRVVADHVMTPTFIDDIAFAINVLIENDCTGIFHVVGSQFISPYEAALKIADTFGFDKSLITKTTKEIYFKGRAPRPFCLAIKNDKIERLGIKMRTFEEGIKELKAQMSKVKVTA